MRGGVIWRGSESSVTTGGHAPRAHEQRLLRDVPPARWVPKTLWQSNAMRRSATVAQHPSVPCCRARQAQRNIPRATHNMQHETRNIQHTTCPAQHATCPAQHATCPAQHATCDAQHATCDAHGCRGAHHLQLGGQVHPGVGHVQEDGRAGTLARMRVNLRSTRTAPRDILPCACCQRHRVLQGLPSGCGRSVGSGQTWTARAAAHAGGRDHADHPRRHRIRRPRV